MNDPGIKHKLAWLFFKNGLAEIKYDETWSMIDKQAGVDPRVAATALRPNAGAGLHNEKQIGWNGQNNKKNGLNG